MVSKPKIKFIPFLAFNILLLLILPNTHAQSAVMLDESNIRLLHHIPNSEYGSVDLSNDGRYLVALNRTFSGAGYLETNPNAITDQYEATYLEMWNLDTLAEQDITSNFTLPFERFLPPDISKKIHIRQSFTDIPYPINVSISSNNEMIAVGIADEIRVYEFANLNLITTTHKENRRFLEWSIDGNQLSYIADGKLIVWTQNNGFLQEYELPTDVIVRDIYPISNGWIINSYQGLDTLLIVCNDTSNECNHIEYDSNNDDLFPVLLSNGNLEVANYTDMTNEIQNLNFEYLSQKAHSPSNRYVVRRYSGGEVIWDVESQTSIQSVAYSREFAWLSTDNHFISVGFPDVITSVSLHEIEIDEPIQDFELGSVIHEDWDFLTNYLTSVTAPMANNATIFISPDNTFAIINFTWVIIYIPIENSS